MLIKGFDNALVGMEVGEKRSISLDVGDAYEGRDCDACVTPMPKMRITGT